jgi:hypothetical protein
MAMEETWVPGNPNDRSIGGFRIRHGTARGPMSIHFYNTLKRAKRGPKETVVNGVIMILPDAEAAWDEMMTNPVGEEAARIAARRAKWHERAKTAAEAAVKSEEHVSRLKLGRSKRPPARARRSK